MTATFDFKRDYDTEVPIARQVWDLVNERLQAGYRMATMVFESLDLWAAAPQGTIEKIYYYAIHFQLMDLNGGTFALLYKLDKRGRADKK